MADEGLRKLERRWKETGTEEDQLAYIEESVRKGVAFETCFVNLNNDEFGLKPVVYFLEPDGNIRTERINLEQFLQNPAGLLGRNVVYRNRRLHILEREGGCTLTTIHEDGLVEHPLMDHDLISIISVDGDLGYVRGESRTRVHCENYILPKNITVQGVSPPQRAQGIIFAKVGDRLLSVDRDAFRGQTICLTGCERGYSQGQISARHVYVEDEVIYYDLVPDQDRHFFGNWYSTGENMIRSVISELDLSWVQIPETSRLHRKIWYSDEKNLARMYSCSGDLLYFEARRATLENNLELLKKGLSEE